MAWQHGTSSGYGYHGCRCDKCKAYKRVENAKRKQTYKKTPKVKERDGSMYVLVGKTWRQAVLVTCEYCGKEFYKDKRYAVRYKRSFCSLAHNGAWQTAMARKVVIKCVVCKRLRLVPRYQAHRYKTCGRERCQFILQSKRTNKMHAENKRLHGGGVLRKQIIR